MVRPSIDLDTYKDEITALFNQQYTYEAICLELAQRYSIEITHRTLTRRLQRWGLRRLPPKMVDNEGLRERIQSLITDNYSDQEILPTLHREGVQITITTIRRIRQQLGLRLRTDNPEAQRIQENQMREVIRQEIPVGNIEGYGKGLLYTHLRERGYLFPR